jgi:hypothetical protein
MMHAGTYDTRPVTLDPGLTLMAVRAGRRPHAHFPFLASYRPRRWARRPAPGGPGVTLATWALTKRALA